MGMIIFIALFICPGQLLFSSIPACAAEPYSLSKAAPYSWYLQGIIYEMDGNIEKAYAALRTAAEFDPEAVPVLIELARVATRLGHTDVAEQWAEEALSIEPDNLRIKMILARIYAASNNLKSAIEVLDDVLQTDPHNEEALFLLGSLYAQSQKFEEAVSTLEKAAKQKGTRAFMAHYYLGKIYVEKGKTKKAKEEFLKAMAENPAFTPVYIDLAGIYEQEKDWESALKMWQVVMQSQPSNTRAVAHTIELLMKTGRASEATALVDRLSITHGPLKTLRLKVALQALQENRPDDALKLLQPLIDKTPPDAEALFYSALAFEQKKEIDRAIKALLAVPAKSQMGVEAAIRAAFLLNMQDRNWEAVTMLQQRLTDNPGNPELILALARLYDEIRQTDRGIELLEQAVKNGSGNKEILMQLAMLCEKRGHRKSAISWALQAIEADPDYAPALNFVGYTWAEEGKNLEKAEEMIKKALSLKPDDGFITDSLGWVYYAAGRYEEAVKELEKAHKLVPEDPTIAEHLADALMKRQKYFRAIHIYRKALELEKDPKKKHKLEKKIRYASEMISEMVDQ